MNPPGAKKRRFDDDEFIRQTTFRATSKGGHKLHLDGYDFFKAGAPTIDGIQRYTCGQYYRGCRTITKTKDINGSTMAIEPHPAHQHESPAKITDRRATVAAMATNADDPVAQSPTHRQPPPSFPSTSAAHFARPSHPLAVVKKSLIPKAVTQSSVTSPASNQTVPVPYNILIKLIAKSMQITQNQHPNSQQASLTPPPSSNPSSPAVRQNPNWHQSFLVPAYRQPPPSTNPTPDQINHLPVVVVGDGVDESTNDCEQ